MIWKSDTIHTSYFSLYPSNKVAYNIYIFCEMVKHSLPWWKKYIYIARFKLIFIDIPANQFILELLIDLQKSSKQDRKILSTYKILHSREETTVLYVKENQVHSNLDNDALIKG